MKDRQATLAIVVDSQLEEAVYAQIARQVRDAVAAGVLSTGAPLPSVRALASDLGVNLNTVARAYRILEDDGFVEIASRAGVRVAPPGHGVSPALRQQLAEDLRRLFVRMRQAGFGAGELRRLAARYATVVATPR